MPPTSFLPMNFEKGTVFYKLTKYFDRVHKVYYMISLFRYPCRFKELKPQLDIYLYFNHHHSHNIPYLITCNLCVSFLEICVLLYVIIII